MFKRLIISLIAMVSFSSHAAVILQYHHVATDTPAITSVTPEQFREQMDYLKQNQFVVRPLSEVLAAVKAGEPLADKTVVITFDDGYNNIADTAHLILKEYGFPYTIFVAIEPIEKQYSEMMSWQRLRQLADEGAEIANHSWAHEHLIRKQADESDEKWLARIAKSILDTEAAIAKHIGHNYKMLAYPYGEYNTEIEQWLTEQGYVGLGQQSGAVGKYTSMTAIPRFPVAGVYADLSSLKVKLHSLNMPVTALNLTNPELSDGQWRPELTVTLDMDDIYPHQLMCFVQGQGEKKPLWISENQFTIRAGLDLPPGRSRYNCTVPSKSSGRYYWFSQAWVRPKDDGSWIKE
ncbi:polysaccharide deacetylase family protein [Shewanella waksmanii]|uniref:polysaccharide deacetylase family protein n=1 Tax=Shewanella waksmanii TaxID=213783 RepID=UPI0004910F30|nr:polysaccharide deacetylase family protein [Shewanella waksmanii]